MSAGKRLCDDKRMHLLKVYREQGFHVAAPLALEYGVTEKMLSSIARENGYFGNHPKRKAPYRKNYNDPRWAWAKERGAVIA